MTIAERFASEPGGRHSGLGQERFHIVKDICSHERKNMCDWSHRQGVKQAPYNPAGASCDTTHMEGPTPFTVVQDAIRRAMKLTGKRAKPLAIAAGLGETGVRDILAKERLDIKFSTLAKLAFHLKVPVGALVGEDGRASTQPPDAITISLDNLATFLRVALNREQEGLFSQDETLALAHMLRSALDAVGPDQEILADSRLWETLLRGHVAPRPSGSPESS